jgi:hypothetical protein
MKRFLLHLLICLSLALSGAEIASARVAMGIEQVMLHDMVICGAEGAQVVTFDASGKAVHRKAQGHCRICPECQGAAGAALIHDGAQIVVVPHPSTAEPPVFAFAAPSGRAAHSPPARAPPKEF